jgi:hypothetical protein
MKPLVLVLLCGGAACAQSLSIGAIGGVPFTDAVSSASNGTYPLLYKSSNFVVGPSLQLSLPLSLRFEVDALYRPVSYQLNLSQATGPTSAAQWQFPFLLQYRFATPVLKPFLEAGLSFDHLSGITSVIPANGQGGLQHSSDFGVVLGAGVDLKIPFVRLSGELRFERQAQQEFQAISSLNQAEVVFGAHF